MNDTTPTKAPAIVRDFSDFPDGYQLQQGEWLCEEDGEAFVVRAASAQDAAEICASFNDLESDYGTHVKVNGEVEYSVSAHRVYAAFAPKAGRHEGEGDA